MNLEDTAISSAYVEIWKETLRQACLSVGVNQQLLGEETVARLQDGSLKVWIEYEEKVIASMVIPADSWVFCGG